MVEVSWFELVNGWMFFVWFGERLNFLDNILAFGWNCLDSGFKICLMLSMNWIKYWRKRRSLAKIKSLSFTQKSLFWKIVDFPIKILRDNVSFVNIYIHGFSIFTKPCNRTFKANQFSLKSTNCKHFDIYLIHNVQLYRHTVLLYIYLFNKGILKYVFAIY